MRRFSVFVFALISFAAPCFAKDEPAVTERQRQLVAELLTVMHVDKLWGQMMDVAVSRMPMDAKERERFRSLVAERINGADVIRDVYSRVFPKYYSDRDIEELIAFYKTPLGQKMVTSMPAVMEESMTVVQEKISPEMIAIIGQMQAEENMPKQTARDMKKIDLALRAWALSEGSGYPEASDMSALAKKLEDVAKDLPVKDVWGHPYMYAVSADRKHYRIVSAGSDGVVEPDSLRVSGESAEVQYSDDLKKDIIYADGKFVQLPRVWQK